MNATKQDIIAASQARNIMEHENKKYTMEVRCMCCQKLIEVKPCRAANDGTVSHGIGEHCCLSKYLSEAGITMEQFNEVRRKRK